MDKSDQKNMLSDVNQTQNTYDVLSIYEVNNEYTYRIDHFVIPVIHYMACYDLCTFLYMLYFNKPESIGMSHEL